MKMSILWQNLQLMMSVISLNGPWCIQTLREETAAEKCNEQKSLRQEFYRGHKKCTSLIWLLLVFIFCFCSKKKNIFWMHILWALRIHGKPQFFLVAIAVWFSSSRHVSIRFALKTYYTLHFLLLLDSYIICTYECASSGKKTNCW